MSSEFGLFVCGDIVIKEYSDVFLTEDLNQIVSSSDIALCNFEAPIESKGNGILKAGPNIFQSYSAPEMIKKAGFTHCSIANNHIYDFGEEGLRETIEMFKHVSLEYLGGGLDWDRAYSPLIVNKHNIKIGLLAFCESEFGALTDSYKKRGGYAWINHFSVNKLISEVKQNVDYLVVIIHAGIEQIDAPLPEWRNRYREIIDLGADIIIGGHPHVTQGYEIYNGKYIFYSLGNFYFDHYDSHPQWNKGIAVKIRFTEKEILAPEIIFIYRENNLVHVDNSQEVRKHFYYLINTLTNSEIYINYVEQQSKYFWENVYKKYYEEALNSIHLKGPKSTLKHLIRSLLKRDSNFFSAPLLLHNIKIESHRWIVERYLNNSIEKTWN